MTGLTRDSAVWLWGKVVGLACLVVAGIIDPATLGLSERQAHVAMMVCGAIAYLSGQMSTSALPGKHDDQRLDPARYRRTW